MIVISFLAASNRAQFARATQPYRPPNFTIGLPEGFSNYTNKSLSVWSYFVSPKIFRAAADFSPDSAHTHNQHQGDFYIRTVLRSSVDNQNDYLRGSTANIDLDSTTIYIHYVKGGCAKNAREHGLERQLALRSQLETELSH